ncbi:MAG: sigma-70 family RNA polymerase sigma factor [Kiritimatiellia bacterium]|jgi:RNA polymerase sigma-70 factor (ECF subfamily)|nr:sigma-70 family RNA polymerase sigma factor [Kiritimatiellia bacterium]
MNNDQKREAEDIFVREAIQSVLQGNIEAFGVIVQTFQKLIAADLSRRLPVSDVQEVAQDVFVRAYRALPGYRGDAPVRIWLLRIARYAAMDFWRKTYRRRDRAQEGLDDGTSLRMEAAHQAQVADQQRDEDAREAARDWVEDALRRLSPDDRAVLTLVELEERSMLEAAQILDCGISAVKVRAFRARKRLKTILLEIQSQKDKEI